MIFVTGDTHRQDTKRFITHELMQKYKGQLSKSDYVIICGDCGFVWDNGLLELQLREILETLPFTILFVDGNHENFDLLNTQFKTIPMFGNYVTKINNSLYHLKRGELYNIEGNLIFTFGGATSIDRWQRTEGVSWWSQEMPTYQEMEHGLQTLDSVGWQVDYVISHTASEKMAKTMGFKGKDGSLNKYFTEIDNRLLYKHWYFGHFHIDETLDKHHTCLYREMLRLGDTL